MSESRLRIRHAAQLPLPEHPESFLKAPPEYVSTSSTMNHLQSPLVRRVPLLLRIQRHCVGVHAPEYLADFVRCGGLRTRPNGERIIDETLLLGFFELRK